ncbi:carbohydrate ABC transporter permease [Ruminococcaceae bacterium OttesenSCG-928-L11]|nr:carbohydrate ABC transporter permease [Ruminococcaceae bacterium OttesenSCG-928-L11]
MTAVHPKKLRRFSAFDLCIALFLLFVMFITLYPFLHVLAVSLSDPYAVMKNEISIFPKGINLEAYKAVAKTPSIWISYKNTILYTVTGTAINLALTTITAYALSKPKLYGRRFFSAFFVFTMFFSGGMIPSYMLVKDLHLIDTMWSVILPIAISTYNLMIMRTSFQAFPAELEEAATVDGCNPIGILFRIVLPNSLPILMTIALYYSVTHWNAYFQPMLYLHTKDKFPLQILMQQILISGDTAFANASTSIDSSKLLISDTVKYAAIIVAVLPIVMIYPFIQKYFTKGVMLGAVKG